MSVLTESDVEGNLRFGFTDNYIRVGLPAREVEPNQIVAATIDELRFGKCLGTLGSREVAA